MTEAIIDDDAGRKRRLPVWMLRDCATGKQRKSGNGDEKCALLEKQSKPQAESEEESIIRKHDRMPSKKNAAEKSLKIYEVKQRTRKARRRTEGPNSSINFGEDSTLKMKHKKDVAGCGRDERAAPKKRSLKNDGPKNNELEVTSPGRSEDEIELTVEDLISIAEEYVSADQEQQHRQLVVRQSGSETHQSSSSIPSEIDLGRPGQAIGGPPSLASGCIQRELSSCSTARSTTCRNGADGEEKVIPSTENFLSRITSSGDAAQDMLNLFLGPLLVKTPSEGQNLRISGIEGMTLVCESKPDRSGKSLKEEATLIKKKSSLKDKRQHIRYLQFSLNSETEMTSYPRSQRSLQELLITRETLPSLAEDQRNQQVLPEAPLLS